MGEYVYSSSEFGQHVVRFINSRMFIDDVSFRVVEDLKNEYVYKIQKMAIKAINGVAGLEKLLTEDEHRVIGAGFGGCFVSGVLHAYRQDKIRGKLRGAKKDHLFSQLSES